MLVALGALQHALELLDERLSLLWIGPAEQLFGFLPRQLASTTACFHDSLRRCRTVRIVSRQHTKQTCAGCHTDGFWRMLGDAVRSCAIQYNLAWRAPAACGRSSTRS